MTKGIKFFFTAFFLSLPFWLGMNFFQGNLENFFYARISQPFEEMIFVKIPPKIQKPLLELQAKSAISVKITESGEEKILFTKDIENPLPLASLTKLMVAVIVLENPNDYDFSKIITISKEAADQDEALGNLKAGDKLSVKNLLYTMLIESSNDAAFALSEAIGVENFVEKMNQKAEILGLINTRFLNPTGLDPKNSGEEQNHSTSQELAKLAQYILKNHALIFEISSQNLFEILDAFGQFHHLAINKNEILSFNYPNMVGGKTGYTEKAGGCMLLVLKVQKNNNIVNVILGTSSKEARVEEMKKLIDWLAL